MKLEYYDYSTAAGLLKLDNIGEQNPQDPHIQGADSQLVNDLISNELQNRLLIPHYARHKRSQRKRTYHFEI